MDTTACAGVPNCAGYGECSGCDGWLGDAPHLTISTALGSSCVCDGECARSATDNHAAIVAGIERHR